MERDACGGWITGEESEEAMFERDCGSVFAVTVTGIRTAEGSPA